jgi:hypothetical protein
VFWQCCWPSCRASVGPTALVVPLRWDEAVFITLSASQGISWADLFIPSFDLFPFAKKVYPAPGGASPPLACAWLWIPLTLGDVALSPLLADIELRQEIKVNAGVWGQ